MTGNKPVMKDANREVACLFQGVTNTHQDANHQTMVGVVFKEAPFSPARRTHIGGLPNCPYVSQQEYALINHCVTLSRVECTTSRLPPEVEFVMHSKNDYDNESLKQNTSNKFMQHSILTDSRDAPTSLNKLNYNFHKIFRPRDGASMH
jgi:hypothetical protein